MSVGRIVIFDVTKKKSYNDAKEVITLNKHLSSEYQRIILIGDVTYSHQNERKISFEEA